MEKEKFDAIMQEIENEVQARLKEKERIEKATDNTKRNIINNKDHLNKNGKKKRSILFYIVVGNGWN